MVKQRVESSELDNLIRQHLTREGFRLNPKKPVGAGGSDIVAEKGSERICTEVIGYKKTGPARRNDFVVAFWQAVSRLNDSRVTKTVVALDDQFRQGLPARIDQSHVAWDRIGKAFPELEIWFVNRENGQVDKYLWSNLTSTSLQ